jgi:MFS transporter, putative metabolite:H+ symporter
MTISGNLPSQAPTDAIADIAARLERLPFTPYQVGLFFIIATSWFFDSIDLGSLTFLLGSISDEFQLMPIQAGVLSYSGLGKLDRYSRGDRHVKS